MTTVLVWALPGVALVQVAQTVAIWRLRAALRRDSELEGRLGQLTSALGLLTDATEAGLSSVGAAVEQLGRRRAVRSPRQAGRRIARAAQSGQSVEEIAAAEAMSESEVHLHLDLLDDLSGRGGRTTDAASAQGLPS